MKIYNVEQGSDEWRNLRLGKWTASVFDKCLTKTGKPSSQAEEINLRLVAEQITGESEDYHFSSEAMDRGKNLENEAFETLQFAYGYKFDKVGFCDSEKGFGCSPDGINVKEGIGLELKCPYNYRQIKYLAEPGLPKQYLLQIQGSMLVTGYKKWVFFSYHPTLPGKFVEVQRDNEIVEKLAIELGKNTTIIKEMVKKVKGMME